MTMAHKLAREKESQAKATFEDYVSHKVTDFFVWHAFCILAGSLQRLP